MSKVYLNDEDLAMMRTLVPVECVGLLAAVDMAVGEIMRTRKLISSLLRPEQLSEPDLAWAKAVADKFASGEITWPDRVTHDPETE